MKTNLKTTLLTTLCIAFGLLSTHAQNSVEKGTNLLNLNLGPVNISEGIEKESLSGVMTGFTYEKMIHKNWALGLNFTFIGVEGDRPDGGQNGYRVFPSYLSIKGIFLEGNFKLYAALGLGVHFSSVENSDGGERFSGFSGAAPLGFYWFPGGSNFFFNGNYTPVLMDNSVFGSDLANTFNLGIGFIWPSKQNKQ